MKEDNKSTWTAIRVTRETHKAIRMTAAQEGIAMSELITKMLDTYSAKTCKPKTN